MRAHRLTAGSEGGHDHRLLRGEALGDPVLARAVVRGVDPERVPRGDPLRRRLHHEAGVHPGEALSQREASQLAAGLIALESLQLLRRCQLEHRPREQVVLHREAYEEAFSMALTIIFRLAL